MSIPAWVLEQIEKAAADQISGFVLLSFRDGVVQHVNREEVLRAPQPAPATNGGPVTCPVCGRAMKATDYSNLWTCMCGAKRTRAQLASARRAE